MPKINKILYATDLSESAKVAMTWAMSLAEHYDATIITIHVIPDLAEEMSASMGYDLAAHYSIDRLNQLNEEGSIKAIDSIKERIKNVCEKIKNDLTSCRLDLNNIIIKTGSPVQEIVATANDGNYDMVVMGTHGHGLIEDLLLGSVARGVLNKCKIPVLTIRLSAK